jgi:hypothetical protein
MNPDYPICSVCDMVLFGTNMHHICPDCCRVYCNNCWAQVQWYDDGVDNNGNIIERLVMCCKFCTSNYDVKMYDDKSIITYLMGKYMLHNISYQTACELAIEEMRNAKYKSS